MSQPVPFKPSPWKMKITQGYIRKQQKQNQIPNCEIPMLIIYNIARYFCYHDKFKSETEAIIIDNSTITGTRYYSQAMGTIPFEILSQQCSMQWTFKITGFHTKKIGPFVCSPLMCIGITDKEEEFTIYCKSSGGKCKQIGLIYSEPILTAKFGLNDTLTITLNQRELKFGVNDKVLFEETDYIPKSMDIQQLFCYICLDENTEIQHIGLKIW